ncbi:probable E3 ubiquitin-protein ligase XERICO [Corylus avellana]|uniref:probable E3 ubiquitin-protein ligase XERICO n=1 Tax=Corylus avellana TaxID=13451 RepID=UPI00286B3C0C|nr:probable E3 ubiquitin-protein ligase XERICO [Corylus avellana]
MGLSINFPGAAEGVLPVLVMNTVFSVALLKNAVRSVLQVVGALHASGRSAPDDTSASQRRISITHVNKSLWWTTTMECCVCLCGFEADEEVSELSCKHFFHKGCLNKWFDNKHTTCPLCRSVN